MRASIIIAGIIAVGAAAWVASGQFGEAAREQEQQKPAVEVVLPDQLTPVRVATMHAEQHEHALVLRGATEAARAIDMRVEISGQIVEILVPEGAQVSEGTLLLRLEENERAAVLEEAEALLAQRQIEFKAAEKLAKQGYRSDTDKAAALAALHGAEAAVERARFELEHTHVLAPFDAVIERQLSEVGEFLDRGDPALRVVELDPLLVVAHANENEVLRLFVGQSGVARLSDGRTFEGKISYVARQGESATRTFRVELSIANPDAIIPAGVTADIFVPLPAVTAYKISPATLVLDDLGRLGVKLVDEENKVAFVPIIILDDEADGLWVTGLPEEIQLIVVGHEFVQIGETVDPVPVGAIGGKGSTSAGGDS